MLSEDGLFIKSILSIMTNWINKFKARDLY